MMEGKPPMQGQPAPEQGGGDEGAGAGALVTRINSDLNKLQDMLSKAGAGEGMLAKVGALLSGFQDLIQSAGGGGGGGEAPPQGPPPARPGGGMGRATSMGGPGAIPKM